MPQFGLRSPDHSESPNNRSPLHMRQLSIVKNQPKKKSLFYKKNLKMQRSDSNEIENKDISEERKEDDSENKNSSLSGQDFKEEIEDIS